jgi:N-sulfoglucosamine sulfohydrolase
MNYSIFSLTATLLLSGTYLECKATILLSQKVDKPNFVFILADDCTLWDIGCYGSNDSKTPNIDRLAEEGIKFENCYQAAPMCSPTRHNIFTGLYPVKTGAYPNHTNAYPDTKSIVHYLKPQGYRVALSGKRHIGPKKVFPFEYLGKKNNPEFDLVEKFLREVKESGDPFALMLCLNEPHGPWNKGDAGKFNPNTLTLPPNYIDTKETREFFSRYLAEINYLDGQVGNALELIEKHGFNENTLVIFSSEQGNSFPFAKWTLYEAGVKSALIARMPGLIEPGTKTDAIVELGDLVPTFIELAGGEIPKQLDGKSLVPLFKNQEKKIKKYSYSIQTTRGIAKGIDYYGIRAIVSNKYRYIWNLTPEAEFLNLINNSEENVLRYADIWYESWLEKAKNNAFAQNLILKYRKRPKEKLYDIVNDKWCMKNLADNPKYKQLKTGLRKELLKWMKECGDKGQETELEAFKHMPNHN